MAATREFTETNTAHVEIAHITTLAAAPETAPHDTGGKLGLFFCARYNGGLCHTIWSLMVS